MAYGDNSEFDLARNRAKQQAGADVQVKRDALARRQAQLGGGPGGAFVKAEQGAIDESQQRLADVNEGIDTAQRAEARRIGEIEAAQKYGTSEREAAQAFATKQREAQQSWQQGNLDKDRAFQEKSYAQQSRRWNATFNEAKRAAGVQESQVQLENRETAKMNRLNMIKNAREYGMSPDSMVRALDNLDGVTFANGKFIFPDFDYDEYDYRNQPENQPNPSYTPQTAVGRRRKNRYGRA